ncbi:hypothetical protein PIB30_061315 [Stylosanthes scabra]|uniref:Uncharacterized protein n=1 Tax=Stylosanthes scabra TaxID=79078 RepID=A0ABU6SKU1_9FABA|nr:hypothetical protein [Stylosanthes scabra]
MQKQNLSLITNYLINEAELQSQQRRKQKITRSNAEESRINVLVFYLARGREDGDRTGRGRQRDNRTGRRRHRKEKRRGTTAETLLAFKEQRRRRSKAERTDRLRRRRRQDLDEGSETRRQYRDDGEGDDT